ncbi:hypothetical protein [Embleya sp. AB8]|uniref:hypothetical protein n=1 Tax=Embleya sp. AB8 TaxID=3156304 RepID=UPI003C710F5D
MSGINMTATLLAPESLVDLPCPERSVELGFPWAAIEQSNGYLVVPPPGSAWNDVCQSQPEEALDIALGGPVNTDPRNATHHGPEGPRAPEVLANGGVLCGGSSRYPFGRYRWSALEEAQSQLAKINKGRAYREDMARVEQCDACGGRHLCWPYKS